MRRHVSSPDVKSLPDTEGMQYNRSTHSTLPPDAENALARVRLYFLDGLLLLRLVLFALTSNGFTKVAGSGSGLALALYLIISQTGMSVSAYNVTGFTSYLFMPYHDVIEGFQSVHGYLSLVVLMSLLHAALITALTLIMYFIVGIDGPPLTLPTFIAGVLLWALGLFGIIALIMGLETLFNSFRTGRTLHADEITFRHQQHPVRLTVSEKFSSSVSVRPRNEHCVCCCCALPRNGIAGNLPLSASLEKGTTLIMYGILKYTFCSKGGRFQKT